MRRLMLLRHAKSDWPPGMPDVDRPLAARGRAAAPRMGEYLKREGLLPDLVLVSPAARAGETFALIEGFLDGATARVEPRLYDAPAARLLGIVREVEPAVGTLLLVGHNPGFEDLAKLLVGYGDRNAFSRLTQKFPTAALAVIDVSDEGWDRLEPRNGRLDRFVTPKGLGADEDD